MELENFYEKCRDQLNPQHLDENSFNNEEILKYRAYDDLTYLFPSIDPNENRSMSNVEFEYLKQIRDFIKTLTKSSEWETKEETFNQSLKNEYLPAICDRYQQMLNKNEEKKIERERLTNLFEEKSKEDQNEQWSIFDQNNDDETHNERLGFFAIQSLTSILLILIKSAEKHDSNLVQQILTLTNQLCGQLPMKSLAMATQNKFLFKSLEPLINYVKELSNNNDRLIAQQAQMALLSFSMAKGSLKDILPSISNFIFDTENNYLTQHLSTQLNQSLKKQLNNDSILSSTSIESFLSSTSMNSSGQCLASIVLAHLIIHHDETQSPPDPLIFEFHPSTYQQLYNFIDKIHQNQISDQTIDLILIFCLRLFRIHLKYLSFVRDQIDFNAYLNESQRENSYKILLHYARNKNDEISGEASKALIEIIRLRSSTFHDLITLLHDLIEEKSSNDSTVLIKEFYLLFNENDILNQWIDLFINGQTENILKAFLDRYIQQQQIDVESILLRFQEFLFYRLFHCCEKKKLNNENLDPQITSNEGETLLITNCYIKYLRLILETEPSKFLIDSKLFHQLSLQLFLLTQTDRWTDYEPVQLILITILPWLVKNFLSSSHLIFWLIGRICQQLIIGFPANEFELKHAALFKSLIFSGSCEWNLLDQSDQLKTLIESNLARSTNFSLRPINENSDVDRQFLLSIYHQTDPGQKLLIKMKQAMKHKGLPILQKTIESLANNALAQIFAVFIKHYRRLNLAQYELSRSDQESTVHPQLLSIYQSATRILTLFATVKGQGGDCEELARKIEKKTFFLLLSIKESQSIPLIEIQPTTKTTTTLIPTQNRFNRQRSRWSKAKQVLKLLQHLFQACIRFKRFMLEKKQAIQRIDDYESLMNRSMEMFLYADLPKLTQQEGEEEKEKNIDLEELKMALLRQNQRAVTRLLTYRFVKEFLIKNEFQSYWKIFLPYLRKDDLDWSYLDQIRASKEEIKEDIARTYYSIIKSILNDDSSHLAHVYSLLNLSYDATDFSMITEFEFLPKLFHSYLQLPHSSTSIRDIALTFQWFRLFTFQLSKQIELDQLHQTTHPTLHEQKQILFQTFILKELQTSEQIQMDLTSNENSSNLSLKDMTLSWFYRVVETGEMKIETCLDLSSYINQYLVLLLRCIHVYPHVIQQCRSNDYLKTFIDIYHHHSQSISTQMLTLKILRSVIPSLNDSSNNLIEEFLQEILGKIGEQNRHSIDIQSELIHFYRTIMSIESPWKIMATELILKIIQSSLNLSTIEKNDPNEIHRLLAALSILGGHIEPYRRGSLVQIIKEEEISSDESQLALIVDIDQDTSDDVKPYSIQYLHGEQKDKVSLDKIQLKIDVEPPRTKDIHCIVDSLSHFIQIDQSKTDSLILIQCQRRALAILNHLLTDKNCTEIFMKKSCGSTLIHFAMGNQKPDKLGQFDREHLEQYALSLDQYEENVSTETTNNNDEETTKKNTDEEDLINAVLPSKYHGWKPVMPKAEAEEYRHGYIGKEVLTLVSIPKNICKAECFQLSGEKHRFLGHIEPTYENTTAGFPSYILDQVQLNEGKWYYCVRLPTAGVVQIGWATKGYSPRGSSGVGDDAFSWSYDGSRAVLFNDGSYYGVFDSINWKENDVCGCGIEINGNQTNIKYWLNGKFLGTAFTHEQEISYSDTKCNLLPHGLETTFFPSVSLQRNTDPTRVCEFIFSPEDMDQCPLPYGYKPLLLPKAVPVENYLIDYPFSAYLIGDHAEDHWLTKRIDSSNEIRLLRDFINDSHLQVTLPLTEESSGLPINIEVATISSMTISFDLQLVNQTSDKIDITLCTLDLPKSLSIPLTLETHGEQQQRIVIIFHGEDLNIDIFVNSNSSMKKLQVSSLFNTNTFSLHLLPKLAADIKNLAIWRYAISNDDLQRLFKQGLSHIITDEQRMKEFSKRNGTIEFSIDSMDKRLLLFNEPFDENFWEKKKKQIDDEEKKYFQKATEDSHYTLPLYGSNSYLIFEKSAECWTEYTFILDLCVPKYPTETQYFTLLHIPNGYSILLSDSGELICQAGSDKLNSKSSIPLKQFFRLSICIRDRHMRIYINKKSTLEWNIDDKLFHLTENKVRFFYEVKPEKIDLPADTVRCSLKSLSYLNRCLPSLNVSVDELTRPPFLAISSSLLAMGYKRSWIETLIQDEHLKDIPTINAALHQRKDKFIQSDIDKTREHYQKIFSKTDLPDEENFYRQLFETSTFQTKEQIDRIVQQIAKQWIDQSSKQRPRPRSSIVPTEDKEWFSKMIKDLGLNVSLNVWLTDKSNTEEEDYGDDDDEKTYDLFDLAHPERSEEKFFQSSIKTKRTSVKYSHLNLTKKQFNERRLACEHGLITIYSRMNILNLFQNWSDEKTNRFPLESLADYSTLVQLVKVLNETHFDNEEKLNPIQSLLYRILHEEIQRIKTNDENPTGFLYHLQKDLTSQAIDYLFESEKKSNYFQFTFQIYDLFLKLLSDRMFNEQQVRNRLLFILFPRTLIHNLFNIFLLVPTHDEKIFLLHLFTRLIQFTDEDILTDEQELFLIRFTNELSSEKSPISKRATKRLETVLNDLIFALRSKQRVGFETLLKTLPKKTQNLFMLIDMIDLTLNEKKIDVVLPETFHNFVKNEISKEEFFTDEDFRKSNEVFTRLADLELIQFIDEKDSALIYTSENRDPFFASLPKENETNETFYKKYSHLSTINADLIDARARYLYLFNILTSQTLEGVRFNCSPDESFLTSKLLSIKMYLLFSTKWFVFNQSLEGTQKEYSGDYFSIHFDTVKASINDKSENTMFYQAYQQLYPVAHNVFRQETDQLWRAQYIEMHSTDQGGPYRDSITRIVADICSTRLSLFILCPNGRMNSGLNRDCWIPNVFPPDKSIPKKFKKQYRFIGQLMGMAIRRKHYLDLKLAPLVWKGLLNEEITVKDIESIDEQSFTMIYDLEKNIEQIRSFGSTTDLDYVFGSILDEIRFDVVSSAGQTYELIPGGSDIPITMANFKQYCSTYRKYRLEEFDRQIHFIRQGLCSIIPSYYLSLFTANELQEMVCGKGSIDIDLLKQNTYYGGDFNEDHPLMRRFWNVFRNRFTDEQRRLFLIFVWGRNTLPARNEDFSSKFSITRYDLYDDSINVDRVLPRSHTCFFTIDLPEYSTEDVMYERLVYAITCCSSIDGDGMMNEAPDNLEDSDDESDEEETDSDSDDDG